MNTSPASLPGRKRAKGEQALMRLNVVLYFAFSLLLVLGIGTGLFYYASRNYRQENLQMASLDASLNLRSYYEQGEFDRIQAYLFATGLDQDPDYVFYQQAADMSQKMRLFRESVYAYQEAFEQDTLILQTQVQTLLRQAYELYHYLDYARTLLVISPNDQLLGAYQREVSAFLTTSLQLSREEVQELKSGAYLAGPDFARLWALLERRLLTIRE